MKSDKPFPIAKITIPEIPPIVRRERLYRRLDAVSAPPVTWITAPAGFGKTALVAGFLLERRMPCIWYRLDEGDTDSASFFHFMGLAVRQATPRSRKPLPAFPPRYRPGETCVTLRYCEDLFMRLPPPFVVVFDDYHHVPAQSTLHDVMAAVMESLPAGLHAVILSREHPPARFARLRVNGRIGMLGPQELRFTLDESGEMFSLKGLGGMAPASIRRLHERAYGWAAGLTLMIESIDKRGSQQHSPADIDIQGIFDYIASEIFDKTEPETREFLVRSAFLPFTTADGARRLTGAERSGELLSRLHGDCLFTDRSEGPNPVFRYHPLFREFLLSRAAATLSARELSRMKRCAATIILDPDNVDGAIETRIDAKEWYALFDPLLRSARRIITQDGIEMLNKCLSAIHSEIVRDINWPVQVYTLGRFELVLDGKSVHFSGKTQRKPLQLLKMLIALGGTGVKEEQLTDLLWPDADGDRAHSAFTTTLSRLRRLIGCDKAIEIREARASLNPRYCWVDVREFEEILRRIDSLPEGNHQEEAESCNLESAFQFAERAVHLYGGHFLPAEENLSWVLQMRSRMNHRFFSLISRFGKHLEAAGQWEKAAKYYRAAVDTDETADEEMYRRLMICHQRLDQPDKAIEAYQRCGRALAATLGRKPSPRTEAIYQALAM